jgi:hypothetical protein
MRKEGLRSILSATFISYSLLYILFAAAFYRHGSPSTYNVFKAAVSLSYIAVILLLRFLDEHLNVFAESFSGVRLTKRGLAAAAGIPKMKGFAAALLFAAFFALNVRGTLEGYVKPLSEERALGVTIEHEALKTFTDNRSYSESDFFLNCDNLWNQMIAEYYAPFGRSYTIASNNYSQRTMKDSFKPGDIYVTETNRPDIFAVKAPLLFSNNIYSVYMLGEESILLSNYSGVLESSLTKVEAPRGSFIAREIREKEVIFRFLSLRERSAGFSVDFVYLSEGTRNFEIKAYVNGAFASELTLEGSGVQEPGGDEDYYLYTASLQIGDISLNEGENEIFFELGSDHSRVWVTNLKFSEE